MIHEFKAVPSGKVIGISDRSVVTVAEDRNDSQTSWITVEDINEDGMNYAWHVHGQASDIIARLNTLMIQVVNNIVNHSNPQDWKNQISEKSNVALLSEKTLNLS